MSLPVAAVQGKAQTRQEFFLGLIEIVDFAPYAMEPQFLEAVLQQLDARIDGIHIVDVEMIVADVDREIRGAVDPIDIAEATRAQQLAAASVNDREHARTRIVDDLVVVPLLLMRVAQLAIFAEIAPKVRLIAPNQQLLEVVGFDRSQP